VNFEHLKPAKYSSAPVAQQDAMPMSARPIAIDDPIHSRHERAGLDQFLQRATETRNEEFHCCP